MRAPIQHPWPAGEERVFYVYNAYAAIADKNLRCLLYRAANMGVVCSRVENENSKERDRVKITLKNVGNTLPTWQPSHRFGLQVGP